MKEKTNKQAVLGPFHNVVYSWLVDREETAASTEFDSMFWKSVLEHLVKWTETQSTISCCDRVNLVDILTLLGAAQVD